jgi:hypothetical protein
MKHLAHTRPSTGHIPSLRERTETRFARGSSPPALQVAGPPERPTCPLDVTELIKLLDVDCADAEVRSTRKIEAQELRTLGVIEAGELPSLAWAKAPRIADMDDRFAPTMIIELADPPARPMHFDAAAPMETVVDDDGEAYAEIETTDDELVDIELTFALGAQAVAPKASLKGFALGIVVGLASVAAAFTALGVVGH